MSQETIFISIASYQDDMLKLTIEDALAKAKYPNRIKFGIVEQREASKRINPKVHERKQIRYVGVEPEDSRGVCWARALCMALYQNEDWYFQIDSHMLFDQHWDEWFIDQCKHLEQTTSKPIISGYPKSFWIEGGAPKREVESGARVHLLPEDAKFADDALIIYISAKLVEATEPIKAWHAAAGCLFARGHFVNEIPYDSQIYFEGEEQTIGLRAFTKGWDMFHVPDMPIFHYWARDKRVSHWDCESDKKRHENWAALKINSLARVKKVLSGNQHGIYGLGKERTPEEYEKLSGINYANGTINHNTYSEAVLKGK